MVVFVVFGGSKAVHQIRRAHFLNAHTYMHVCDVVCAA